MACPNRAPQEVQQVDKDIRRKKHRESGTKPLPLNVYYVYMYGQMSSVVVDVTRLSGKFRGKDGGFSHLRMIMDASPI